MASNLIIIILLFFGYKNMNSYIMHISIIYANVLVSKFEIRCILNRAETSNI